MTQQEKQIIIQDMSYLSEEWQEQFVKYLEKQENAYKE